MRALPFIAALLRSIVGCIRSRKEQAILELALRQQLETYAQTGSKPKFTSLDRTFWAALVRLWPGWKEVLVIVEPDTLVRWHRGEDTHASQGFPPLLASGLQAGPGEATSL